MPEFIADRIKELIDAAVLLAIAVAFFAWVLP